MQRDREEDRERMKNEFIRTGIQYATSSNHFGVESLQ
jgi:hypothetical protein